MTNEKSKKMSLPKVPKANGSDKKQDNDHYYLKTQASSLLSKYSGRNKLEIHISLDEKQFLKQLESIFLNKFGLNHVICFASKCIKSNHPKVKFFEKESADEFDAPVKIKPTQETLESILLDGKKDSASYLASLGIYILKNELSLDCLLASEEH